MTKLARAEREIAPWVERLARLGYLVKGAVYVTVGVLALQVALGVGGRTTGTSGALVTIAWGPYGLWLLAGVVVGPVACGGYAVVQSRYRQIDV